MPRSGTQLLTGLLRQHPLILEHGEMLATLDETLDDQELIARSWGPTCHPPGTHVGITVMMGHFACRPLTLSTLLELPGMSVIVLERRDQLGRLRSMEQAAAVWNWGCDTAPAQPLPQVVLHPIETHRWLQAATIWHWQMRHQIRNRMVWLYYEDLVADHNKVMEQLFEFLNVAPCPLNVATVKQETRPLAETVTNYAELAAYLATTNFRHVLDEES